MSARYEVTHAEATPLRMITSGAANELGEDMPTGTHALIIGDPAAAASAITGTPGQLRAFATQIAAETGAQHADPALRLHAYNELAAQAADFIATYDTRVDAYRLPADEDQDPRSADLDPEQYEAYFDMRATWGEYALDLVRSLASHAPPEAPAA
ncbi:hypothetical protein [Streptomyces sp. SGAir0957]